MLWQREEESSTLAGPMCWKDLSPRVLLPILVTCKIQISEAGWREWEGGYRRSNSERYGGAVPLPETIWKRVRAILYWIWLLIGSQWRLMGKGVMWRNLGTLQMSEVHHSLNFIKQNLRRASRESITVMKPGDQEWKQKFCWLQNEDTVGLIRSAWFPGKLRNWVCSPVLSV